MKTVSATFVVTLGLIFALKQGTHAAAPRSPWPGEQRPLPKDRLFNSSAVEDLLTKLTSQMKDRELANIFANAFPNTLDTTVLRHEAGASPDTFIITGDIHAQWLRDSTNQVAAYMPLLRSDPKLVALVCGLVRRQARDIRHDAYANAFNFAEDGDGWQNDIRKPAMTPHVYEGKYELDSLAAALKLSYGLYKHGSKAASAEAHACEASSSSSRGAAAPTCFDAEWLEGMEAAVQTIRAEQAGTGEEWDDPKYKFQRETPHGTDTLIMYGHGPPGKRCGLSKCMFRPSDDATTLPFLIPANAMAVVELRHLHEMLESWSSSARRRDSACGGSADLFAPLSSPLLGERVRHLSLEASRLAAEIDAAVQKHGIVAHPEFGRVYAFEVDGYGNSYLMDDANIPSLLALPYLGYVDRADPVYVNTRRMVLSEHNPYLFTGSAARGIGGPHVGFPFIWPMALSIQGLTAPKGPQGDEEVKELLAVLKRSTAGTGFMHEAFHKDDPSDFTREWFAWANSVFSEFVIDVAHTRPHLLF